ncbi:hypothetical protein [Flavobacterium endoglycinae]|nr:hypothetical protein [Flavobacterium endoglycinae]
MTAMDYRQYDNALGRFNFIDVLAELFPEESPFSFSLNNPVFFSDPTGLCPECEKNVKDPKAGQSYTSSGGATYTYNDGKWTQQGGELAEVTITATPKKKSTEGQDGKAEGNTRLFGLIQNAVMYQMCWWLIIA